MPLLSPPHCPPLLVAGQEGHSELEGQLVLVLPGLRPAVRAPDWQEAGVLVPLGQGAAGLRLQLVRAGPAPFLCLQVAPFQSDACKGLATNKSTYYSIRLDRGFSEQLLGGLSRFKLMYRINIHTISPCTCVAMSMLAVFRLSVISTLCRRVREFRHFD